jgi:hypothetical protein|tara:strand:- start:816 stop:1205 length:390 start_codon:yes stop_codon:yes gene_type:complete
MKIFGFPVITKDINVEKILYSRALNMNENQRVPVSLLAFNSSNVHIPLKMDFTQRKYFWSYYTILDVVSAIGGVNAAFSPLLKRLAPWFMLYFLYALACIIKEKYLKEYRNELTTVVNYSLNQLKMLSE